MSSTNHEVFSFIKFYLYTSAAVIITAFEFKTGPNFQDKMDGDGNIKVEIVSGSTSCITNFLDVIIRDDFESGNLDRFAGSEIYPCQSMAVESNFQISVNEIFM